MLSKFKKLEKQGLKIINVGVYPPPYGGVSNHLKRLLEYLQTERKDCLLIDLSREKKRQKGVINHSWLDTIVFLLRITKSIVHFHNFSSKNTLLYFLISLRHSTVLSFHNERSLKKLSSRKNPLRYFVTFFLNRIDYIVVDNLSCKQLAEKIIWNKTKIKLIPEFIPPTSIPPLRNELILEMRNKYKYLISSNAFQISFYKNQDLYGLDIVVELLNKLVHLNELDVGIVFLLPNIGNVDYFKMINRKIKELNLTNRFLFVTEPIEEASSLWKVSDLVIRATNTDGNSLTILEALSLDIPVLASDCVERPEGAILFKNRDVEDMCRKVVDVLLNSQSYREKIKKIPIANNADSILKIYEDLEISHGQ
jgi:glycosyltransferase involved in cell wall biosynthesis